MNSYFPTRVSGMTPKELLERVMEEIQKGSDLYTQPFVAATGEICQYMTPGVSMYEYRLIDAKDLTDLDTQVENLWMLKFDFMFGTFQWNGHYLQWMQRMNATGDSVKEVLTESLQISSEIADKPQLQLVTAVTPLLHKQKLGDT